MLQKIAKFREYLNYIEEHYLNVQKAWVLVQDKCKEGFRFTSDDFVFGMIDANVKVHDSSKLSIEEFHAYRYNFFPTDKEEKGKLYKAQSNHDFKKAWEHHKEHNAHHWQTWCDTNNPYADIFVVEMVLDWIAMSMKFGGTARDYYEENKETINIPDWSIKMVNQIFDAVYDEA